MSNEKMPKIRIDSDGTPNGTSLYIDGIPQAFIQNMKFEAKHNKDLVTISTTKVYPDSVVIKDEVEKESANG
jgi:hypothetical protein